MGKSSRHGKTSHVELKPSIIVLHMYLPSEPVRSGFRPCLGKGHGTDTHSEANEKGLHNAQTRLAVELQRHPQKHPCMQSSLSKCNRGKSPPSGTRFLWSSFRNGSSTQKATYPHTHTHKFEENTIMSTKSHRPHSARYVLLSARCVCVSCFSKF